MEQENNNSSFIQTISILDILSLLISKCFWIILAGIIVATGVGLYTEFAIEPTYESYTTMPVFNKALNDTNNVTTNDLAASETLATTYTVILKSKTVLSAVIDSIHENPKYTDVALDGAGVLSVVTLVTAVVSSIILELISKKCKLTWLEPFIMPIGMILGMVAAIICYNVLPPEIAMLEWRG